ncbi:MAG: FecR family protein [Firmicutes bacterium]|nr:FecR family protein [Bacillota bacterium]
MCSKMIFRRILFSVMIVAALICTCIFIPDSGVQAADSKAKQSGLVYVADIVSIQGNNLTIKRSNCQNPIAGRVNMADYLKDILTTDNSTVACIEFLNGSQVALGKNTCIEIITSSNVAECGQAAGVQKMSVKSGSVWGKMEGKNNNLKVDTGNGVMGVKGTEFIIEKNGDTGEETITLLEGSVDFTTQAGEKIMIKPGEEVSLKRGQKALKRMGDVKKLRELMNNRHHNLNPGIQRTLAVFAAQYRHLKGSDPERAKAMASRFRSVIDNPGKFIRKMQNQNPKNPGTHGTTKPARSGIQTKIQKPDNSSLPVRPKRPVKIDNDKPNQVDNPNQDDKPDRPVKPHNKMRRGKASGNQGARVTGLTPNRTKVDTYYPMLAWDKVEGAASYQVVVARNPFKKDQDDPIFQMVAHTDKTQLEYPSWARSLKPGQSYFWIVIPMADEQNLAGLPSKPAKFTMAGYKMLGVKGLYPIGDIAPGDRQICFNWTPVLYAEKYRLLVADNKEMNNPVLSCETEDPFYLAEDASACFTGDKVYYWTVIPLADNTEYSGARAINKFRIEVVQ